jgi:IQ calmodulin-binding motif
MLPDMLPDTSLTRTHIVLACRCARRLSPSRRTPGEGMRERSCALHTRQPSPYRQSGVCSWHWLRSGGQQLPPPPYRCAAGILGTTHGYPHVSHAAASVSWTLSMQTYKSSYMSSGGSSGRGSKAAAAAPAAGSSPRAGGVAGTRCPVADEPGAGRRPAAGHMARRRSLQRQRLAAVAIQAAWRAGRHRDAFLGLRLAATRLQALARGAAVRRQLGREQAAAVAVRAAWRGLQARRLLRSHRSALRLQAAWRGARQRRSLAVQCAAAVTLQAAWRGLTARRALRRLRAAAVAVQAAQRGRTARAAFVWQRSAAIHMQVPRAHHACHWMEFKTAPSNPGAVTVRSADPQTNGP